VPQLHAPPLAEGVEVTKIRSAGSCPPFGAVVRFCILPPDELALSQVYVPENNIGKLEFVPDAMEVVEVTVTER
jgi:hypothetical protein